jgi:Sulfotransferase domain
VSRHLLVIGAQRCGTTYLQSLLEGHPEIAMARPSRPEPKVFCDPEASALGVDWYRHTYFAHADPHQLLGEKSTSYLEDPAAAPRAAAVLGEAHIVVVLRDPVRRAISNWRFSTEHGFESRPLETALRDNLTREAEWDPDLTSVSPFAYLERGRYMHYLAPWLATFPDTTHVVLLPELVEDDTALEHLFKAVGVDAGHHPERPLGPVNSSEGDPPALSAELRGTLESYFEVSDRALSAHLGRSLPW